jgi:hypothetical protein
MKYIKMFNESKLDDFQEEAKNLLSYYIDEYQALIDVNNNPDGYKSVFIWTDDCLRWGDCKDDLITYITYIKDKYKFKIVEPAANIRLAGINKKPLYKMMDDIESIDDDFQFWEIFFRVKL